MNELVISKDFTFEASHVLPKHEGKCSRLHGHSWGLTVSVIGSVNHDSGFVLDYAKLKKVVQTHIIDPLDHTHLGYAIAGDPEGNGACTIEEQCAFGLTFYPSSENLVVAIAKILIPLIPEFSPNVRLFEVALKETCTSAARYRPDYEVRDANGAVTGRIPIPY